MIGGACIAVTMAKVACVRNSHVCPAVGGVGCGVDLVDDAGHGVDLEDDAGHGVDLEEG